MWGFQVTLSSNHKETVLLYNSKKKAQEYMKLHGLNYELEKFPEPRKARNNYNPYR